MTTERDRDPLERLRALNPVRTSDLDGLVLGLPAQTLFQRVIANEAPTRRRPVTAPRPWPRRRRPRLAAVAVVASLSVAVAGYALVERRATKPQTIACFAAADLEATTAVVGVERDGPVVACAGVWAAGFFGNVPTPPLRACVLESGVVGVFPEASGQDVCVDLDLAAVSVPTSAPTTRLPAPAPDLAVDPERVSAFRDAVRTRLTSVGCVGPAVAEAIVREELGSAGLEGWTIRLGLDTEGGGFTPERPCATLSVLPEQRTVLLVPLPVVPAD